MAGVVVVEGVVGDELGLAGLHHVAGLADGVRLQAAPADRAGHLAVFGYQHAGARPAVGGALHPHNGGQGGPFARHQHLLVHL